MELPLTSELKFLNAMGNVLQVPSEWEPCYIEIDKDPSEWESLEVRLQENSIEVCPRKIRGQVKIVGELPRLGPGNYKISIKNDSNGAIAEHPFRIKPSKINEKSFQQMIAELHIQLPIDITVGLNRLGAFGGIKLIVPKENTLQQEMTKIRRAVHGIQDGQTKRMGLVQILNTLSSSYHQVLVDRELWVDREKARRPRSGRIYQAFTKSANLDHNHLPYQVIDTRVDHTADIYENRLLKLFSVQVRNKLNILQRLSKSMTANNLEEEVNGLCFSLGKALSQAKFLRDVRMPEVFHARNSMVLLKNSTYRAALDGFLEFQRTPIIQMDDDRLSAPLENLPSLYQSWCTFQVLAAVIEVSLELGFIVKKHQLVTRKTGEYWVHYLKDGSPALILVHPDHGTVIKFIPERSYSSTSRGVHSISFLQKPDIAIEIIQDNQTKILIFDPKYKLQSELKPQMIDDDDLPTDLGTPKKVDIDKMHSYRDAIRDKAGQTVVEFAAILYPGKTVSYSDGLAAIRAYPGETESMQSQIKAVLKRKIHSIVMEDVL
ncbi:MAG: hypothetical protein K0S39_371 [Paenibacillus sp.]|nr:hypothetical protein [Paenibacillus sp.]